MFEKEKVTHNIYGEGTVEKCDGHHLVVRFSDDVVKTLSFDFVVRNGLVSFRNELCQSEIDEYRAALADVNHPSVARNVLAKLKRNAWTYQQDIERFYEVEELRRSGDDAKAPSAYKTKRKLLDIFHEYGFEGFLHTTELDNFQHIVRDGFLFPRAMIADTFVDVANQSVIEQTDDFIKHSCRFYYYFKTPTNYRATLRRPVILVFDERLIYRDDCYFTEENAAKSYNGLTDDARTALDFRWDGIFERGPYQDSVFYVDNDDVFSLEIRPMITGMRNAEFLIYNKVDIRNIVRVYFCNQRDLDDAKAFCSPSLIEKFCVDRSKFV